MRPINVVTVQGSVMCWSLECDQNSDICEEGYMCRAGVMAGSNLSPALQNKAQLRVMKGL
jgi:hypothetical protein